MKIIPMINSQLSDLRLSCKINSCGVRAVPLTCTCGGFHDRMKIIPHTFRTVCGIRAVPLTCTCGDFAVSVRCRAESVRCLRFFRRTVENRTAPSGCHAHGFRLAALPCASGLAAALRGLHSPENENQGVSSLRGRRSIRVMTSAADFIAQRRFADECAYLIKSTDPETAPRLAPGMLALRECLAGTSRPVPWTTALAAALRPNDLAVKTMDNMIRKLISHGFVVKSGEYSRTYSRRSKTWKVVDTRKLALGDWPDPTAKGPST